MSARGWLKEGIQVLRSFEARSFRVDVNVVDEGGEGEKGGDGKGRRSKRAVRCLKETRSQTKRGGKA